MVIAGKYLNRADWQTPYTIQNGPTPLTVGHTIPSSVAGTYVSARYGNLSLMGSVDQNLSAFFIRRPGDRECALAAILCRRGLRPGGARRLDDELQRHLQQVSVRGRRQ
jgi:hypothetical protein